MQIGSDRMTTKNLLVHVPIIIIIFIFKKATNGADVSVAVSVILMHDLPSLLKLFSHPVRGRFYTKYSRFS